jgi:Calx-beta domain-containing protein
MSIRARLVFVGLLAVGVALVAETPAFAPCHIVQWISEPYRVSEGKNVVTLTVSNGGNAPGTVDYATVDGPAKAGKDYKAKSGFIRWPNPSGPEQSFTIPIVDDRVVESDEAFKVHLSHPTGCTGFTVQLPPDARVTIADDDPAPNQTVTATKSASTTGTSSASATSTPSKSPTTSPTKSVSPTTSTFAPTPTATTQAAAARKSGGVSGGLIAGIIVAALLIAAIAYGLVRRGRAT